eukprot:TRINITY_DN90820_c0_g1_i1.p1 TRINITY_DN90820_c0_g1~~TRINITY_DN90820_c0_g1_i1.p1  ORF type:complete len:401 (-),score=155.25 TRINITY_DN90820_c0_g1_i1:285-1487(-)
MAAVGQEFWIVAAGCDSSEKDGFLSKLAHCPALNPEGGKTGPVKFSIPDGDRGLPFGSFDSLVRLTDDLAKADQNLDSTVHRLERQFLEIDGQAKFMIKTQRQEKTFSEYLASWEWDEAKYPKTRQVADNLALLTSVVQKLDEEVRTKTAQYNEAKTAKSNIAKKDGVTLPTRDLVDLLTPEKVVQKGNGGDDFIETDHMTTVCVIVPRGSDKEFLAKYETFCDDVVPGSAKKFVGMDDKDGNMLFRVVVFKAGVDAFKKSCREKRVVPRDFEYSKDGYAKLLKNRADLEEQTASMHTRLKDLCQAAWSDVMVAWMHVKAMRVFVESVLRYGIGKPIAVFIVSPKAGAAVAARRSLGDTLKSTKVKQAFSADKMAEAAAEEGEEYYPYVSFSFTPFASQR